MGIPMVMEPDRRGDDSRVHPRTAGTVNSDATRVPSPPPPDLRSFAALTQPKDGKSYRTVSDLLPAAHEDLTAATAGGYDVKVLTKMVGGEEKIAVLFGEKHCENTEKELTLASNVLRHFSTFLVEGVDPDAYLGGPIYFKDLLSFRKKRCDALELHNKGSINLTATTFIDSQELAGKILNDMHEAIQRGERHINIVAETYNTTPEVFKQATAIIAQQFADKLDCDPTRPHMQAPNQVHRLEQDHRPTMASQFYMLNQAFGIIFRDFIGSNKVIGAMLLTTIGWGTLTAASSILPGPIVDFARSACGWTALAYWATLAVRAGFIWSPASRISKAIEHSLEKGFDDQREKTMARNSNALALSDKVQGPILIQMGAAHVEPVAQGLIHSFGWVAAAGPEEEPS